MRAWIYFLLLFLLLIWPLRRTLPPRLITSRQDLSLPVSTNASNVKRAILML